MSWLSDYLATAGIEAGVDSLAKSGDTPLLGDVTLSAGSNVTLTQVGQNIAIASSGGGGGGGIGTTELIYRYTVSGSDKASIDTGVDTTAAGSNDWTNGDLLEVFLYLRTDEASANSDGLLFFNNDTGSNYSIVRMRTIDSTQSNGTAAANAGILLACPGSLVSASQFGSGHLRVPNYAGTVGKTAGTLTDGFSDPGATGMIAAISEVGWSNTAAVTRLKITPSTGGQKFVIGSQILIYKRLAS